MTNTKFTPGPWKAERIESSTKPIGLVYMRIYAKDGSLAFAGVYKDKKVTKTTAEANAHLIAAAPDLYAALSEAKLQIEYLHEKFAETGSGNNMLAKIDAALAKASGEWSADDILKREG